MRLVLMPTPPAGSWAQQIADVSSRPEFMNATIQLRIGTTVLVETRARIIGVRSQEDVSSPSSGTATGTKAIRVQFPFEAYPERVERGVLVRVVDGGRNPALEARLIVVEADNMSSQRASHTLECAMDIEAVATWT